MIIRLKHSMLYPRCAQTIHYPIFSEHFSMGLTIGETNDYNETYLLFVDTSKATKLTNLTERDTFRKVQCEDPIGFLLYDVILTGVYLADICEQHDINQLCIQKSSLFNQVITYVLLHLGIDASEHICSHRFEFSEEKLYYRIFDSNNDTIHSFCMQDIISADQYVYSDLFEHADKISREIDYEQFISYYVHKENYAQVINTLNDKEKSIVLDW